MHKKGVQLFITLTYKVHMSQIPSRQFIKTILPLIKQCDEVFQSGYVIYPELTKNGNIHYHIIATLNKANRLYTKVLPCWKDNGFVIIKIINNLRNLLTYASKDIEIMKQILIKEIIRLPISSYEDINKEIRPIYDITDYSKGSLPGILEKLNEKKNIIISIKDKDVIDPFGGMN